MRLNQRRWLSAPAIRASAAFPASSAKSGGLSGPRSIWLEDIARASHRLQIARKLGVALDLAPEPRHLHVHGPQIAAELRRARQILARHRLVRLARQRHQQRLFGAGELDRRRAAVKLAALQVEPAGAPAALAPFLPPPRR